jgi:uncharacterized protein (TIGR03437 family)
VNSAVTINGANQTVNFTAAAQTWTISGTITPTAGGNGATVTLSGAASATTTANSSGSYTFSGLANGAYTVTPTNAGYSFTPVNSAVTINGANQTVNFSAAAQTWTISGTITPTAGGNGATVTLTGAASASTTANSSGSYTFSGLANGAYTVTPSKSGYSFTPVNSAVTINGANQTVNFTAAAQTWTISGTITPTAGGNGATVTLSGAASASTTANSSGSYTFSGLANGAYTVTPSKSGYSLTPVNSAVTINGANQTVNFTAAAAQTWTISGTITPTAGGNGATVTLSGAASATTTANSSGSYTFTGLANGAYTVTPSKSSYSFTPVNSAMTINGANQTVNFTAAAQTWTISGTIAPTAGGSGATVTLSGAASATTTANSSGSYTFTGMANGSYTLTPSHTGYTFTPPAEPVTVSGANVTAPSFTAVQSPPTAPGNLTGTAASTSQINLSWTASTSGVGLANYILQRCQGAGCANFAQVASFAAATTTYSDSGMTAGTMYSYRVQASDTGGNLSPFSNVASAATPLPSTTITYMQSNYATPQTPQTTVSVKFNAAQAAGDLNVAVVGWNDSRATVKAVTDTKGNAYTLAVGPTIQNGLASQSIYYAKNIASASAGANSVTVTFSVGAVSPDIRILEYSGADPINPVDVTAANSGNNATSSSGSVTTTSAADLLFGANLVQTITSGPGSGFTKRLLTSPDGDIAEDLMVTAIGNYSATAPLYSGHWIMQMVAFRTPSGLAAGSMVSMNSTQPSVANPLPETTRQSSSAALKTPAVSSSAAAQTWTISGTISPTAAGSGATVTLNGAASAATTANASGSYTFTGLADGSYTVTPSMAGYSLTPANPVVTINGANPAAVDFTAQVDPIIGVDVTKWTDNSAPSNTLTSPSFSTAASNELLLAFIATDKASASTTTVASVSGAGLTWQLVVRTNAQGGTSEIWRAFAPVPLSSVSVTAAMSQSVVSSMTIMTFTGVDTSGANGSGAIGHTATGQASSGGPAATLVTTRNNSWAFGIGNDPRGSSARTPGAGQSLVHQALIKSSAGSETFWVQMQNNPAPIAGATVTMNDTNPAAGRYNLSIVEVLPATSGSGQGPVSATTSAVSNIQSAGEALNLASGKTVLTMFDTASRLPGAACSPGGLVTLAGEGFTTQSPQKALTLPLPTKLGGVEVKVNGSPAPLSFASDTQVNFQCPQVPPGSALTVTVENENGVVAPPLETTMQPASPAIFAVGPEHQGMVFAASTNDMAMPKTDEVASRPVHPGEYLTIYATGLGEVAEELATGTAAPLDRPVPVVNQVSVIIGGQEISPTFAGLAPGTAGVYQIDVQAPQGIQPGAAVPLYLKLILAGGRAIESNPATIAVDQPAGK